MKSSLLERAVSGVAHLVALAGILILIINMIGFPLFPQTTMLWLIPNTVLALLALKWSRYALSHLVQALSLHLMGIALAGVPWTIRMLGVAGILSERWYFTGFEGSGATPAWSLMTGILSLLGLLIFGLACEASVRGFTGDTFRYPLLGRLAARIIQ